MSLGRAVATVGSLTLASRVLGFVRDAMIAAVLGASVLADAFFVAFKLANLLRRLFAEGAFNAGFVPLFAKTLEAEGPSEARRFLHDAFRVMAWVLLAVVLTAELFMPWLVRILAAGFEPGSERFQVSVELSRITFPYLLLISLAALLSGVLNSLHHFAVAAAAPILLNLVLISALLLAVAFGWPAAHALAWGVALAGVFQLAMVAGAAMRLGFGPALGRPRLTPRVRRLLTLVVPGAFGAGVYQINLLIDTWFASHLPEGAISHLFYADRLNQLPLGMIGVALGTALLPLLSRQLRAGEEKQAHWHQNRGLELGLLLTLPAATGLIVLAQPIVSVLFERGAFGPEATRATAGCLAAFSIGLPAYVLIKVLAPGFFAREDTRTPVIIAAYCLIANAALAWLLIGSLAQAGIALATALANWINAGSLAIVLHRRGHLRLDARAHARLPRIFVAAAVMAVVLWLPPQLLPALPVAAMLAMQIAAGVVTFFAVCQLIGAADLRELKGMLRRRPAEPSATKGAGATGGGPTLDSAGNA